MIFLMMKYRTSLHKAIIGAAKTAPRSPIRELKEYTVPLGYPRTEASLGTPEALELKEQLIRMFRKGEE